METSSEETQEQRWYKRATNESSQSPFCCIYWGCNLLLPIYLSAHKSPQQAAPQGPCSQKSHVFACRKLLMVQLWMLPSPGFISTHILWFNFFFPSMLCLIEVYRLQDVSADWAPAAGGWGCGVLGRGASPQVAIIAVSHLRMKSCL